MKWFYYVILLMVIVGCTGEKDRTEYINPLDSEPGVVAAKEWLKLIDSEEFGTSWDQASLLVKDTVTRDEWIMTMNSLTKQYAMRVDRKTDGVTWLTVLPGAPESDYCEVRFFSEMDGREVHETITMQKADEEWLVAGYFIR